MTAHLRRRAGAIALAGVLGVSAFALATPAAGAQDAAPSSAKQLDKQDRELVAEAEKAGKPTVTLVIAAERGRTDQAVQQLRDLGGKVETAAKDVDYIKVEVPRDKAEKAAQLGAVKSVDVDGLIKRDDPKPEGTSPAQPQTPPGKDTPRVNPYLPTGDTGAAQFAQHVPQWDGRGTTVAILDSGIDLDTAALAKTTTGERKIVDWYDANDPVESGDGTWVPMSKTRYTGRFTAGGRSWVAPSTGGPYTIGVLAETAGDLRTGELAGDLNRDGDKTDTFGVLQDVTTKEVRVDTDGDGDFTNNNRMIDYRFKQDVGHFNPAAGTVAFVVQTDRSDYTGGGTPYVDIGIAGAAHGTHVSGIVAGNSLFGGKMAGAAPGAKLMAVKVCLTSSACTNSGLIDGLLYAARNGADAINISIGGLPALNDGNNARADLYNRTIAEFNVQLFISAGNSGAGMNTVGDPSVATDAISVGSSITDATWLANYGSVTPQKQGLHPFSSRGPREDGGFKPDIVAPGSAISTIPPWQPGGPVSGTYPLPAGYAMFNGTSMAAPQATGAAALLISAYKATHHGQRPPVAALREAIKSTAKFVPGLGAYEQGAGLFDVSAAFHRLQDNASPVSVTASVPVSTVLGGQLKPTPNQGVGIYDHEGVTPGKAYTRTYTLTRTSGPNRNTRYDVQWTGNDGTFRSAGSVVLPLNKPVSFEVRINPRGAGIHSALLKVSGTSLLTMNTVVAAAHLTAANGYTSVTKGSVGRNESTSVLVRVPVGATALKVDMAASTGQIRFLRNDPSGVPLDSNASTNCYLPDAGAGCAGGTPTSRTVVNPMPGVWEIAVESRRTSDALHTPFTITSSLIGTKISPDPDTIANATLGTPIARTYSVSNQLSAITAKLVGGPLGSRAASRPTIAKGDVQKIDVTLPAGMATFTAKIGNPADKAADLDMIVYNCTGGSCVQAGSSGGSTAEEQVTIANPAAGHWQVEIDGYDVPTGTTAYDYSDIYISPSLGSVSVTDAGANRPTGTTWAVPGAVTALAAPGAGRVLVGELQVVTDDGSVVGRSSVVVQSVS